MNHSLCFTWLDKYGLSWGCQPTVLYCMVWTCFDSNVRPNKIHKRSTASVTERGRTTERMSVRERAQCIKGKKPYRKCWTFLCCCCCYFGSGGVQSVFRRRKKNSYSHSHTGIVVCVCALNAFLTNEYVHIIYFNEYWTQIEIICVGKFVLVYNVWPIPEHTFPNDSVQ